MAPRTSLAIFLFLNLVFFSYTSAQGTCPRDALQLKPCIDGIFQQDQLKFGDLVLLPCCSLIHDGLSDLEAVACLCTALKKGLHRVDPNLPTRITFLFNFCGKKAPKDIKCV
ncbi:Hydrophobic seed protein domain-containing protein [Hirschfeldia incana]|nr:Hydrophobic seed protein domain-containing protein [Hirschfeldia incana]